jgi:hypothetical protein
MKELTGDDGISLARLDLRKLTLFAVIAFALAILPNLPGVGGGGPSRYLYTTSLGAIVRWVATAMLVLIGAALLLGIMRARFVSPSAVWLKDGQLSWGLIGTNEVSLSAIKSVVHAPARHALKIETSDGQTKWLPIRGLRSEDAPQPLLDKIRGAIPG